MSSTEVVRKFVVYSLALLFLVVALSAETMGWGDKGHRIVARLAAQGLTRTARAAVGALLADDAFLAGSPPDLRV